MNVISRPNLFESARRIGNQQLSQKVSHWYDLAARNNFASFVEVKQVFRSADLVGDKVVFNLGAYRMICGVSFQRRTLFFRALLDHSEYDQGGWKP